jgi:hypothetical protein
LTKAFASSCNSCLVLLLGTYDFLSF